MSSESIATIVAALLGSGVLSTLISNIFQRRAEKRKQNDGVNAGVRMLLYDKIKYLGLKHIAAGKIKADELEDLIEMHRTYHGMGGNGFLDSIMEQVHKLPISK